MIELIAQQKDTKLFKVSDYLSQMNVNITDAKQIIFLIKKRQNDKDIEAVVSKSLDNGIDVLNGEMVVYFYPEDFDTNKLIPREQYVYGIGFKFNELESVFLEPKIVNVDGLSANYVTILPNFVNS